MVLGYQVAREGSVGMAKGEGGSGHEPGKQQGPNVPEVREGAPRRWPHPDGLTTRQHRQAGGTEMSP